LGTAPGSRTKLLKFGFGQVPFRETGSEILPGRSFRLCRRLFHLHRLVHGVNSRQPINGRTLGNGTMKMRTTIVATVLNLFLPAVALSDSSVIDGFGVRAVCKDISTEHPQVTEKISFQWAAGFMSGLNAYLLLSGSPMREDGTDLRKWPEDKQQQTIRAYCDSHPLTLRRNCPR
jgi:hypothetical protein